MLGKVVIVLVTGLALLSTDFLFLGSMKHVYCSKKDMVRLRKLMQLPVRRLELAWGLGLMNLTGPPIALHSTDYLAEQLETPRYNGAGNLRELVSDNRMEIEEKSLTLMNT